MPLWRLLALLAAVAVVTALLALWLGGSIGTIPGAAGREADGAKPVNEGAHKLVTRPDLHPASVTVTLDSPAATRGYYFVTQGSARFGGTGPMIVDRLGRPVWLGRCPRDRTPPPSRCSGTAGGPC